ncbi:MAG: helix-turn-helix domain-containing protein [Pseudobdellovibrio sp.]|nr:helix-turn-helix domain-containing protein [Pseudobdellovibrio sp.]
MKTRGKKLPRKRYKNQAFLVALGENCRRIRLQRGYSIDRLSRESEQLSPASIDRLENGTGDSQILVLVRYAQTLNVSLLELFSFVKNLQDLSKDSRIIPYEEGSGPPLGYVPVYPLHVAAGLFGNERETSEQPLGWVDANIRSGASEYFASFVHGESMQPRISDGSLCLFRKYSGGSRQGKIFLVRAQGLKNSETGEAFVLKKYVRQTPPRTNQAEDPAIIHLISENPRFSPIVLVGLQDEDVQTIAEFIRTV